MPTIEESYFTQQTPLNADLKAGIESISYGQTITFTQYVKVILPLDGFVFWVKADILSSSALSNALALNATLCGQGASAVAPAKTITAKGSLHFASSKIQDETEVYGINKVTFNSEDAVHQDFSTVGPNSIYIGVFTNPRNPDQTIKFAFSDRQNFYQQAGIWHYIGDAVYPFMESQIIDDVDQINTRQPIVSNSLPLWLKLNNYEPTLPAYGFGNSIPLYPSYIVDPNERPPYGVVHIDNTQAIAAVPFLTRRLSHFQQACEKVSITLYGANGETASTFLDCVLQYIQDYQFMGLRNAPIIRDGKVRQTELSIIAMKKSIEFEVNYYQHTVRDIARQIICQAIPQYVPAGGPFALGTPFSPYGPYGYPVESRKIGGVVAGF